MRWIALAALLVVGLGGCFESQLRYCANGAICPETLVCTERTPTVCGAPEEVEPCKTTADRTACASPLTAIGTCESGVCAPCVPDYLECRYGEWKQMQSPTAEPLKTLWVVGDNDVYAAGAGVLVHYDGTTWSTMQPAPTSFAINGIWASAAGDVVAVDQDGNVFHWSSGSWSPITPSPKVVLFAIWGTQLSDLVVVGLNGAILRYDGSSWTPMTSNTMRVLNAVWGNGATIVAAGAAGTIQRYTGASWQAAPNTPIIGNTYRGVWTTASQIFVVGSDSTGRGIIQTQQAAGWNPQSVSTMYLSGVWGTAEDDVYAVGDAGTIMHFDGVTWMPMTAPTQSALEAVGGTATNVFAIGAAGTILRYTPL
jgi:hypothetical protein